MTEVGYAPSRLRVLGEQPSKAAVERYSVERDPPPTLPFHAADDRVLPKNYILMYTAPRAAGVPADLHIFENGGHGSGLRDIGGPSTEGWPTLMDAFTERPGIFEIQMAERRE